MKINYLISFLIISMLILSCTTVEEQPKELEDITLKLKWLHQAQFTGNYVAAEKGFYADEGLNVNIVPFSFEDPTIDAVVNGDAEFGIASAAELIQARAKGIPLKAFAVIYKITPDCAYSLKESGITKPHDFIGKTVGIEPGVSGEWLYYAMMEKLGIDRTKINEMYIGYDATELLNKTTDISLGYSINEPHQAIEAGHEVNIILMADYGVNVYADVLFATEETINNNPELVEKFLRATLDGWQYAIENEEESVDFVLKYATDRTRSHEAYMLSQSIPLIHTGNSPLGWMENSKWKQVQNLLLEQDLLESEVSLNNIYTMQFLEYI